MKKIDLTGQRFGRLTVLGLGNSKTEPGGIKRTRRLCVCDCGSPPKLVLAALLRSGKARGCGCLRLERVKTGLHRKYFTDEEREAAKKRRYKRAVDRARERKYGVTARDFEQMLCDQNHKCQICGDPSDGRTFHVDHRHVEGFVFLAPEEKRRHVRGLLCSGCNSLLGMSRDSKKILANAILYLEKKDV